MHSYNLSSALEDQETLYFFAGFPEWPGSELYPSGPYIDHHYTEVCKRYDATAGVNATEDDMTEDHGITN